MGEVWAATDHLHKVDVAVKLIRSPESWEARKRFAAEIEALRSLQHQHVVRLIEAAHDDASGPFFTMGLLDRESLTERLSRGPLNLAEAVSTFDSLLQVMAAAHAKQLPLRLHEGSFVSTEEHALIDHNAAAPAGAHAVDDVLKEKHLGGARLDSAPPRAWSGTSASERDESVGATLGSSEDCPHDVAGLWPWLTMS